jgi:hypothetical protein
VKMEKTAYEKFHKLYASPNISRVMKPQKIRCVGM